MFTVFHLRIYKQIKWTLLDNLQKMLLSSRPNYVFNYFNEGS